MTIIYLAVMDKGNYCFYADDYDPCSNYSITRASRTVLIKLHFS